MADPRNTLLIRQFDVAWALCAYHLERLEPDDFLWAAARPSWTLHRTPEGGWRPDWAEAEPEPVPVPTVAWLTWHVDWWWSGALAAVRGETPPGPFDVVWPGPGAPAVARLRALRTEWLAVLEGLTPQELDAPAAFPWPPEMERTVADLAAWVTVELTKNAAEIGQLRMVRTLAAGGTAEGTG